MVVWLVVLEALSPSVITFAQNQTNPPLAELLQKFERTKIFWQQFELAKQIVNADDRRALQTLEPWLGHEDRHLRGNAAFVFASLGDERGFRVIRAMLSDRSYRPEGQGIPGGSFNLAAPAWWLSSQIEADRYYAVHLLGELKDAGGVDLLIPLLNDDDINFKAAWALGEIKDRRAVAPLIEALRHKDALVRISAIHALERLRAKEAVPFLRAILNDTQLPRAGDQVSVGDAAKATIANLEREP